MFKNRKILAVILSIILLVYSVNSIIGFAYYEYTQESGTNFFVGTADKADALEDTNEMRQILDDLGNLLGHSKRDDSYPKDLTTGGTLSISSSYFADSPEIAMLDENEDITGAWTMSSGSLASVDSVEMSFLDGVTSDIQTQFGLHYLKTEVDTIGEVETIWAKDITDSTELAAALTAYYLKTAIDTIGEVEAIWSKNITDSNELATALTDYYLKTAIDTLGELETIWAVDVIDSTELASDLTSYYLKTAIDTIGEVETIYGVDITDSVELAAAVADYYLKTEIDELSEVEAIYSKDIIDSNELATDLAALNLTSFVEQTAWRVFYSDSNGDVTELALGDDGKFLMSNGAAVAPTFETPAGAGDMLKATYDAGADDIIDAAAGGTGVANAATETITLVGDDPIQFTTGGATTVTLPTTGTLLANVSEDTTPELGGELDAGAHSIGFTQQSTTGDGTTTVNWTLGNKFKFTFGAQNDTFTFTAPSNPCNVLLVLIQDGTGSRTATWPGTVKWAGGTAPTLTTAIAGIDTI